MSIKTIFAAMIALVALGSSLAWGQCDKWTTSNIQNCNGMDYELWSQYNAGTSTMTITGGSNTANGGTFEADWNNTVNVLFRSGKKWGEASTTTPKTVGNITIDFEATWNSGDDVKMLGVYGWAFYPEGSSPTQEENGTKTAFNDQIEYYIIQDRGSYNPASKGKLYGEGTIDGIAYEFRISDRIKQPDLSGGNGTFKQYFSIPKDVKTHRQSGKISVSKHYEAWEKAGMRIMDCRLYEVAMKVESYSGETPPNSKTGLGKGNAKVTRNILTIGGSGTNEFALTTNISPTGAGTVTKSPSNTYYAPDASVQLTATPNAGWKFVGWEGAATGTTSPATVTMSKDQVVTAKFALVSGDGTTNLLKDGNFPSSSVIAEDGASWKLGQGTNWGSSVATSTVGSGTATINVTTIGTKSYQPQLVQYGLALEKDMSYKLTFKAKAAAARKIEASFQQSVDPWGDYASKEFDLTTTEQDYEFVFTMTSASDPESQFAFNLGQATGAVSISDVKLVHTTIGSTRAIATRVSSLLVSVKDRTLNVSPVAGSRLLVRVVDLKGKVIAHFHATDAATFSLSKIPVGLYFLDVTGIGVKQSTPIVLK